MKTLRGARGGPAVGIALERLDRTLVRLHQPKPAHLGIEHAARGVDALRVRELGQGLHLSIHIEFVQGATYASSRDLFGMTAFSQTESNKTMGFWK